MLNAFSIFISTALTQTRKRISLHVTNITKVAIPSEMKNKNVMSYNCKTDWKTHNKSTKIKALAAKMHPDFTKFAK